MGVELVIFFGLQCGIGTFIGAIILHVIGPKEEDMSGESHEEEH